MRCGADHRLPRELHAGAPNRQPIRPSFSSDRSPGMLFGATSAALAPSAPPQRDAKAVVLAILATGFVVLVYDL